MKTISSELEVNRCGRVCGSRVTWCTDGYLLPLSVLCCVSSGKQTLRTPFLFRLQKGFKSSLPLSPGNILVNKP